MEGRLRLTERNYRYLFDNASDAMWVQDMDGNIVDVNRACAKLTGFTREELLGKNVRYFIAGDSLELAREVRRRLLTGEEMPQPYEQRLRRKDGTIATMMMSTSPVVIDGELRGFQHVARDVTEEKHMEENMRFYVQQITRAQEDERRRIARELHDESSPPLILLVHEVDALASSLHGIPAAIKNRLENLRGRAVEALEGLRRCAQDLRPRILDDLGLVPALEWMADNMTRDYGIEARVRLSGEERKLPEEAQVLLFRIAQEALSNIRRHAEASKVLITLDFHEESVRLAVRDNGHGFRRPKIIGDLAGTGRLGLLGMQERARLLGGSLTIRSAPGRGTTVEVEAPV